MHSFFSTHIQVSEVLDTVLNNTDAVPAFMKLRGEQRSQREEKAEEWWEEALGVSVEGTVCCVLLSNLLVLL